MDLLKPPKEDIARSEVISVTKAQTEIKAIILADLQNNVDKSETERKLMEYIKVVNIPKLDKQVVDNSLRILAKNSYWLMSRNLRALQENYKKQMNEAVPSYKVDGVHFNYQKEIQRFRPFIDTAPKGLVVIEDYRNKVRAEVRALSSEPAKAQHTGRDGVANYSLRNYAEMKVRYEANARDVDKLVEDGKDLVWTSSHADSSIRCEEWQGRLYSLQGRSGSIDGVKFTPISEALAGKDGDGNGIINGYNCRHRLIEYEKGSRPPTEYSADEIRKQREIDQRQRKYENDIRNLKIQEKLNRETGDKEFADRLKARWKILDNRYQAYSFKNRRAFYRWRTEIE